MAITKDRFSQLRQAVRATGEGIEIRAREAAEKIGRIFFQAVLEKQPISEPDDRGLRPAAWQGGRPAIEEAWSGGPEITSERDGAGFVLRNLAPHVRYFVWSIGGVRQDKLGTSAHRIPTEGDAREAYGHPLVFWWKKMGRVERRWSWVDHPGFTPKESFIEEAWKVVQDEAMEVARQAGADIAFGKMREFFR